MTAQDNGEANRLVIRPSAQLGETTLNPQTVDLLVQLVNRIASELNLTDYLNEQQGKLGVSFTPGAYLMLLTPMLESQVQGQNFRAGDFTESRRTAIESLSRLLISSVERPARTDVINAELTSNAELTLTTVITSHSVIKAFWENFCNIPPFCGER